jgi:hypothetical protein
MCFERTSSISNFDLSSNMYGSRSACCVSIYCRFAIICDVSILMCSCSTIACVSSVSIERLLLSTHRSTHKRHIDRHSTATRKKSKKKKL